MNEHEVRGGARYLGGKVEKAIGDAVGSRDWQVTGVLDQVSGATENLVGRAQSVAGDLADATPGLIATGREHVEDVSDRAADAARRGADRVVNAARRGDERLLWAAAAAVGGYLAGWLVHRRAA